MIESGKISNYKCGNNYSSVDNIDDESLLYILPKDASFEANIFKACNLIKKDEKIPNLDSLNFDIRNEECIRIFSECRKFKNRNVLIKVNGPITILSSIIGLSKVFLIWRNYYNIFYSILDQIKKGLEVYIKECINNGAGIISYADAVCTYDILGPKYYNDITNNYTYQFLTELNSIIQNKAKLHICPQIYYALKSFDLIDNSIIKLEKGMSYENALINYVKKGAIVGNICLENRKAFISEISVINIKK